MKLFASVLLVAVCVGCIARIVVVDLAERRIPRQLCWVIAASGALLQLMVNGTNSVLQGALCGVAVVVVCNIVSALLGKNSIGGGDVRCMAALSLATGWGAPVGFFACFAVDACQIDRVGGVLQVQCPLTQQVLLDCQGRLVVTDELVVLADNDVHIATTDGMFALGQGYGLVFTLECEYYRGSSSSLG